MIVHIQIIKSFKSTFKKRVTEISDFIANGRNLNSKILSKVSYIRTPTI